MILKLIKEEGYNFFLFSLGMVLICVTLFSPPAFILSWIVYLATSATFAYLGTLCVSYALVTTLAMEVAAVKLGGFLLKCLAKGLYSCWNKHNGNENEQEALLESNPKSSSAENSQIRHSYHILKDIPTLKVIEKKAKRPVYSHEANTQPLFKEKNIVVENDAITTPTLIG